LSSKIARQLSDQNKVESTAWLTAYLRTFSDIPFSQEIFTDLEQIRHVANEPDVPSKIKKSGLAPQLEARFKLIDSLVARTKPSQILELAAGLSSRGLSMALKDSSIQYSELDFPGIIEEKRRIFLNLAENELPSNLHFNCGNALLAADIEKASSKFNPEKPLSVINEGLMRYLTFEEKTILAKNVYELLAKFGGEWITPDISLKKILDQEDKIASNHTQILSNWANRKIKQNLFEDVKQAKSFFEEIGFEVEQHSFLEVTDQLVSPKRLSISRDEVCLMNESPVVFVMTLRTNPKI